MDPDRNNQLNALRPDLLRVARLQVRDAGAAELLEEKSADPESFALLIRNLLADDRRRDRMAVAASGVLPQGAAGLVADVLEKAVLPVEVVR